MSIQEPDSNQEPAPERGVPDQPISSLYIAQHLTGPLTIIKGHAQLIRRRAHAQSPDAGAGLERSAIAIEQAVQQLVDTLVIAPASGVAEEKATNTEGQP